MCNFTEFALPKNASVVWRDRFIQGLNSWGAPILGENALGRTEASVYGGMAPPDQPHHYIVTVYALADFLQLENGFGWNQLLEAMKPHLLAAASLTAIYLDDASYRALHQNEASEQHQLPAEMA